MECGEIPTVDAILKHIGLTETGIEYVERGRRFNSFILYFSSVFQYGVVLCNHSTTSTEVAVGAISLMEVVLVYITQ